MERRFDQHYLATVKKIYDAERQQQEALPALAAKLAGYPAWARLCERLRDNAEQQAQRLEALFEALYLKPAGEPCWVSAALLREAADAAALADEPWPASSVAVALLSLKRYEIARYESLIHWSFDYDFAEAVSLLARSLAEEIVAADGLGGLAFDVPPLAIVPHKLARAQSKRLTSRRAAKNLY